MGSKFNLIAVGWLRDLDLKTFIVAILGETRCFIEQQIGELGLFSTLDLETGALEDIGLEALLTSQFTTNSNNKLFSFYPLVFGKGAFILSFKDNYWIACLSMEDHSDVANKMICFWNNLKKHQPIFIIGGDELEFKANEISLIQSLKWDPFENELCEIALLNNERLQEKHQKMVKGNHNGLLLVKRDGL